MIRNFRESDITAIADIYERSNNAVSLAVSPDYFRRDRQEFVSKTIWSCENLVCEYEGKVVGSISCSGDYIEGLFVLPEFWNKGIGSELLGRFTERGKELFLQVYADNRRAVGFYKKHGFKICGKGICPMTRLPYLEMSRKTEEAE